MLMIFNREEVIPEKEEKPEFVEETIDEIDQVQNYIEKYLAHFDIDAVVKIEVTGSSVNSKTWKFEIGDQKGQIKINNGKIFVRVGGGWMPLKEYIGK